MARTRTRPKIERVFEQSRLDAELRASAYERLVPVLREHAPRVQDRKQSGAATAMGVAAGA
jgi:hypothetical protein